MFKYIFIILLSTALSGCANKIISPLSTPPSPIVDRTYKIFTGIPVFLSAEGTAVRLDDTWMLTVEHNYPILFYRDGLAYHPDCDVALYKDPTDEPVEDIVITKAEYGTPVSFAGYPDYYPIVEDRGIHLTNVIFKDYPNCLMSIADTGVMAGMGGGGVWNTKDNSIVGVLRGWTTEQIRGNNGGSTYTPLSPIADWIQEVTGKDFRQPVDDQPETETSN